MNITDILSFLRKPATGSEALRSKLAAVAEAIPSAEAEAERLAAERAKLLLTASDAAIEKIEKAESDARRTVDRLTAARDEIARRLDEAERTEARAALDAERAEAERLATETAERVRREYANAAQTIAALVDAVEAAERRVATVNARLTDAGWFDDLVKPVEARAIPEPANVMAAPFKLGVASLPPAPGFPGLGLARERAEMAGYVAEVVA